MPAGPDGEARHRRVTRRLRQARRLLAEDGGRALANRIGRTLAERLAPGPPPLPVRREDVLAADLTAPPTWRALSFDGPALTVNWLTTPPAPGSGGHTTMFRLIRHLQERGHRNRVYLYDVYGNDVADLVPEVRAFAPWLDAPVADAAAGMDDAHVVVATSWPTAYRAYVDGCAGRRAYLVQDLESSFYAAGSLSALAESTYRMGFHGITAGAWLPRVLAERYGMAADAFPFGADSEHYRLDERARRDGVVYYARPSAPRRAYELGALALELVHRSHPETPIHLYGGDRLGPLPFPVDDHGRLTPAELGQLYNRCRVGLSLSTTNVSLVPHEMLAAGCTPVVNDTEGNRVVLDNDHVRYAALDPHALANAVRAVLDLSEEDDRARARAAARSVEGLSWADAGDAVERALLRLARD